MHLLTALGVKGNQAAATTAPQWLSVQERARKNATTWRPSTISPSTT